MLSTVNKILIDSTVTEQLIAASCAVDLQTKDGVHTLHVATSQGHETVTKQLIETHCNIYLLVITCQ